MPLNDDPDALSDEEYEARSQAIRDAAESAATSPCEYAPPADEIAAALARLEAQGG